MQFHLFVIFKGYTRIVYKCDNNWEEYILKKLTFTILLGALMVVILASCAGGQSPNSQVPSASPTTAEAVVTTAPTTQASATAEVPATGSDPTATQPAVSGAAPAAAGALRFELIPDQSEARYRVREQLVNVDLPNDAIGATKQVSGSLVVNPDGTFDPAASRFEVDLSTLQSDRSQRDNFVRRNVLQTDQYPKAVFVPTKVEGLTFPLPDSGQFNFKLTGDLTIRDVTKEVTWDVTGSLENGQAKGLAKTEFNFATFNLNQPRVPIVLSIEDHITLELDGTFSRVGDSAAAPAGNTDAPAASAATPAGNTAATAAVPVTGLQCSAPAEATPPMTEGPYYKAGAPERTSLIEPGMTGTKLVLTGYVLTPDCQPVPNALVDFWQADAQGSYDNTAYRLRGQQHTDASGMYRLETVIPGLYPGRTEHIHVKVQAPNGPVLTSQLFFPDVSQNQSDRIFDQRLLLNIHSQGDPVQATYNFIVPLQ